MYWPILIHDSGPLKGKWRGKSGLNDQKKKITFPSGAVSWFSYLEKDKDADSWYGSELAKIYFDEFHMTSRYAFDILRTRNRSQANVEKGIRCTLNPDPYHFVYDWVQFYLDDEGYPRQELSGVTRYFIIHKSELYTSWDFDELRKQFYDPALPDNKQKVPRSYTYIPATLEDNPKMTELNPEYRNDLDSQNEMKRKQLLLGCWSKDVNAGMYWKRDWLKKTDRLPINVTTIRSYDLAHSEPSESYRYPDYTASICISKDTDGYYYLHGDYIESFKDENTNVYGRFRKRSGDRDKIILKQAEYDGKDVRIVLPQEGGAGKDSFEQKVKMLASEGFVVNKGVSVQNHHKITRFEGFASACENGLVYIIESSFTPETLEKLYEELEIFDGSPSTSRRKDDWVDACSEGFNVISRKKALVPFSYPNLNAKTKFHGVKKQLG